MPADSVTPNRPRRPQLRSLGTTGQLPSAAMWMAVMSWVVRASAAIEHPPSDHEDRGDHEADHCQHHLVLAGRLRSLVAWIAVDELESLRERPTQLVVLVLGHRLLPPSTPISLLGLKVERSVAAPPLVSYPGQNPPVSDAPRRVNLRFP